MTAEQSFVDSLRHLIRVKKIFDCYCREGNRPTRQEAKSWLVESEGWKPYPLANLLREWGYEES